jgi:hypothetical protein
MDPGQAWHGRTWRGGRPAAADELTQIRRQAASIADRRRAGPARQLGRTRWPATAGVLCNLLVQRGRLHLQEPVDVAGTSQASLPVAALGLTLREAEVLALVAKGRTNRQIGQALFITPRPPASTSHGSWPSSVNGRGEAAAVAHRLGLDKAMIFVGRDHPSLYHSGCGRLDPGQCARSGWNADQPS